MTTQATYRNPRPPNDSDFGPSYPTSDPRLRYQRLGRCHWRFVQVGTGRHLGDGYESERDLLADLPRFAAGLDAYLAGQAGRPRRRRLGRRRECVAAVGVGDSES